MSALGTPNHTTAPKLVWRNLGCGQHYPETCTKVPSRPTLLKRYPPSLEDFTLPTKNSYESKLHTQFDNLPLDTLHNIDARKFSLMYHEKSKKVLTQLTQNDALLFSTRYYKLKYPRLSTVRIANTSVTCG